MTTKCFWVHTFMRCLLFDAKTFHLINITLQNEDQHNISRSVHWNKSCLQFVLQMFWKGKIVASLNVCNIVFLAQPHRQKRWSAFRRSAFVVSIRQIAVTSRSIKQRRIFIKIIPGCPRRHHIDIHAQIIVSCAVTNGGWEPSTPDDDRPFDIVVRRRPYNTRAHRVPPEGGHVPVPTQNWPIPASFSPLLRRIWIRTLTKCWTLLYYAL